MQHKATPLAILGLGAMGSRMARRLLDAGYPVTVFNRSPERCQALAELGARVAATPREAASGSETVLSMVRDEAASRAVWLHPEDGAIHGLSADSIAIESSTLTRDWTSELAATLEGRAAFLDAPVVGSRPQAEAGQLIYLVGGEAEALERVRPVFEVLGGAVHHLGDAGSGTALKLAVNALFGIQVAALGELIGLLRRAGIASDQAAGVLSQLPVTSPAAQAAVQAIAARSFAPLFPIELVEKDLRYLLASGEQLSAALPLSEAARATYAQARDAGYGDDNITGIAQLFDR
ncbi:MAG: NAD(P)-dependent oxidoreductase [Acidobacteriota bacterium]